MEAPSSDVQSLGINKPLRAYELQTLQKQARTYDPEERVKLLVTEGEELAKYICASTEGNSHEGELCPLRAYLKGLTVTIENACSKCETEYHRVMSDRRDQLFK